MRLRVLDTDGAVMAQPEFGAAVEAGRASRVDLGDLAPALRLWASPWAMGELAARLRPEAAGADDGAAVNFLGSGDFHHLAVPLIAQSGVSVTVVHFDNHPDWVNRPPIWHCGSWVNRALELPNVSRVITIGPCAADLDWPELKGGNRAALVEGRLEIFPWRRAPSWVLGGWGRGAGHRQEGRRLIWRNVGGEAWSGFVDELSARLAGMVLWLSIDKDVLEPRAAVTNWDQGEMALDDLTTAIRRLAAVARIAGVDVCGDYSPLRRVGIVKRLAAWFDQPPRPGVGDAAINRRTNRILLDTFAEVMP